MPGGNSLLQCQRTLRHWRNAGVFMFAKLISNQPLYGGFAKIKVTFFGGI